MAFRMASVAHMAGASPGRWPGGPARQAPLQLQSAASRLAQPGASCGARTGAAPSTTGTRLPSFGAGKQQAGASSRRYRVRHAKRMWTARFNLLHLLDRLLPVLMPGSAARRM